MRTTTATINLIQEGRKNKNGKYPISLIVYFNGKAKKATGVAVSKDEWSTKTQRVKASVKDAKELNKTLSTMVENAVTKRNQLDASGQPYTAKMVLEAPKQRSNNRIMCTSIVDEMNGKNAYSFNTLKNYKSALKNIASFHGSDVMIHEIDEEFARKFAKWMQEKGLKAGTISSILSKVQKMWNYAIDEGLVESTHFPFRKFKYWVEYKAQTEHKNLPIEHLHRLEGWLWDRLVAVDMISGDMIVKQTGYDAVRTRCTDECAVMMFILGYRLQGLALVDLASLRKEQVTLKKVGDDEYYIINDVRRQKTNKPVKIIVEASNEMRILMTILLKQADERCGYLLPIYDNFMHPYNYVSEKDFSMGILVTQGDVNRHLRKVVKEINIQGRLNYDDYDDIDENITFYYMRHTFATTAIRSGVSAENLATMMGRRIEGISRYVQELTQDEELIAERKKIWGK